MFIHSDVINNNQNVLFHNLGDCKLFFNIGNAIKENSFSKFHITRDLELRNISKLCQKFIYKSISVVS